MAFQLNQFALTNQAGETMSPSPNVIAVRMSSTMSGTVKAGDVVKMNPTEDGQLPVVDKAVSGDSGFGVVLFNAKKATYAALDVTEIALAGSIVTMVAGTAINRSQLVSWNSVSGYIQATAANYIGLTLDEAAATGDIVRVLVQPKLS